MKYFDRADLYAGILIVCIAVILLMGVHFVPFHPDETSLLYQSRDLEVLLSDPLSLAYDPNRTGELDQTYRALNPPLPKYLLAIGRRIAGYGSESVSVDWNWSQTWEENKSAGAIPDSDLLDASRTASTVMVVIGLIVIYLVGKKSTDRISGMAALLFLGMNALVLLHGRRAMSEGVLIFGVSLAILGIIEGHRRPWLAGLGTAIAACTKLSAAALAPVGLISVFWLSDIECRKSGKHLRRAAIFLITFALVYIALNPFTWLNPIGAIQAQWHERTHFLQAQVETIEALAPNQILNDPTQRLGVMLAHLFISEPQFAEVGNYLENTAASQEIYLSDPFHKLFRGLLGGGLMFALTLLGVAQTGVRLRSLSTNRKRILSLLLLGSIVQAIALLWANPLPFQRYYVPMIPFISLWMAISISYIYRDIKQAASKWRRPANGG
jgi:4-amino-4-deoxy-L-arabinose transferase-like glycosyltransferase